ncbi:MAG: carboxypeptidase regulatory-like domain-containing protein, partial [Bacteroidetes bacterium]|nr:carboxypeptidase regulatory-like domain-containing protein [Bacteroidota bacterium]
RTRIIQSCSELSEVKQSKETAVCESMYGGVRGRGSDPPTYSIKQADLLHPGIKILSYIYGFDSLKRYCMNVKVCFITVIILTTVMIFPVNAQISSGTSADRRINDKQLSNPSEAINRKLVSDIYRTVHCGSKDSLCVPQYSTGCSMGDGFIDFAVGEIENYGSGCDDLNGTGWSQYLGLGPALLLPGISFDFIMSTGYGDQYVSIWIDFNDDFELTPDEKILSDFNMSSSGTLYTAPVEIPANAAEGQHIMRARTNWAGSCNDPCESYTYGEAEDYYVIVGNAAFGSLEGVVTELSSGEPIEGALISLSGVYYYSDTTGSDGQYHIDEILAGNFSLTCSKTGYNIQTSGIAIVEDSVSTADFILTHPEIWVNPESISIVLAPNTLGEQTIFIENPGNGQLDWSASLQITSKNPKDFMDLQFQYPVEVGGGEAGIETDGEFLYTTKWNGAEIYKYATNGTYLGSFTIDGASALRDLAYDGTYFYGGAGLTTVYEMDFTNQILVSF